VAAFGEQLDQARALVGHDSRPCFFLAFAPLPSAGTTGGGGRRLTAAGSPCGSTTARAGLTAGLGSGGGGGGGGGGALSGGGAGRGAGAVIAAGGRGRRAAGKACSPSVCTVPRIRAPLAMPMRGALESPTTRPPLSMCTAELARR